MFTKFVINWHAGYKLSTFLSEDLQMTVQSTDEKEFNA